MKPGGPHLGVMAPRRTQECGNRAGAEIRVPPRIRIAEVVGCIEQRDWLWSSRSSTGLCIGNCVRKGSNEPQSMPGTGVWVSSTSIGRSSSPLHQDVQSRSNLGQSASENCENVGTTSSPLRQAGRDRLRELPRHRRVQAQLGHDTDHGPGTPHDGAHVVVIHDP